MFTQHAFIRKNTPELRKKLEELGYYPHPSIAGLHTDTGRLHTGRGFYSICPIGYSEDVERPIDCGTNEELFLAIAAMRDDRDYNQWYIDSRGLLFYIEDFIEIPIELRKAIAKELVKHFKTK